jgi:2-phospho-L-lactate guanylyltransferase (CobY/MobA/RfbA family)
VTTTDHQVTTTDDDEKRKKELSCKLRDIMRVLEGLSLREIEVMLANIQASVEQDSLLILVQPNDIEYRDLKPSRHG